MFRKIFIRLGLLEDLELKEKVLDQLELAQEEDKIRQEEIRKRKIAISFMDNLLRADNHEKNKKLLIKWKTDNIRIAKKMEEEEKNNLKNTKLFIS